MVHIALRIRIATALASSLLSVGASAQSPATAQTEYGFSGSIGGGIAVSPQYNGAKKLRAAPIPELSLEYKSQAFGTVDIGARGLRWMPVPNERYSFGALLAVGEGRDEKGSGLNRNAVIPQLKGLGKVRVAPEAGLFGSVNVAGVEMTASVLKGTKKGHNGAHGEYSADVPFMVGAMGVKVGTTLKYGDSKYTQAFFGVTQAQAVASKLPVFKASAGLVSYGMSIAAEYPLANSTVLRGFAGIDRLAGDAAKSPIAQKKLQPAAGLMIAYNF